MPSQNFVLRRYGPAPGLPVPDTSGMLVRKFPCANCTSVFSRKGGLTYHQKFECGQKPRFNCPYCTYRARHISNARRHVRKCHPGREVYTVDLCQLQQHAA
ncbi:longitudinals lacking protein, isoforms A/B/D/L-like [Andrena cerasifolii]|uniref:longitudinals lacking protein, isoforms A/B/D/L-like n=1 Tax=Andrena cerasifolii TaxID=2819439 RepID=UPI002141D10A